MLVLTFTLEAAAVTLEGFQDSSLHVEDNFLEEIHTTIFFV